MFGKIATADIHNIFYKKNFLTQCKNEQQI